MNREKVIKGWECHMEADTLKCADCPYREGWRTCNFADTLFKDVYTQLKEQETKTGKWIPIESPTGVEAFGVKEMAVMNVCCSVCGSEEDVSFTGYKYCPRCGAKMEGR